MDSDKIQLYTHEKEGFLRKYENSQWCVALKNHAETNGEEAVAHLEKHLYSDEIFILLQGKCTIISAVQKNGELEFEFIDMESGTIYMIPKKLWHNTITYESAKLVVIENSDTSSENSERIKLDKKLIQYR